jgi:hypothetical protein
MAEVTDSASAFCGLAAPVRASPDPYHSGARTAHRLMVLAATLIGKWCACAPFARLAADRDAS